MRAPLAGAVSLLGLLVIFAGIALVITGAGAGSPPDYGPPLVYAGFATGLLGLAVAAWGMTRERT